jgi:hypothetical protein
MKLLLIPLLLLGSLPAYAGDYSQPGGTQQTKCFKRVYREEYIPGTRGNPGRVRSYTERVRVPCDWDRPHPTHSTEPQVRSTPHNHPMNGPVDDNSCIEGSVIGGIAGAAAGAALSRDEGMFIGIPLGIVGGALVGCQIDGG